MPASSGRYRIERGPSLVVGRLRNNEQLVPGDEATCGVAPARPIGTSRS